jgi:TonB family protein
MHPFINHGLAALCAIGFAASSNAVASEPKITAPKSDPRRPLIQPPIPKESLRRHEEGTVGLMMWVDESGKPQKVAVTKSSGYPRLDDAAQSVLVKWRLKPGTLDGVPTAMWGCFVIVFGDDIKGWHEKDKEALSDAGKICERANRQHLFPDTGRPAEESPTEEGAKTVTAPM